MSYFMYESKKIHYNVIGTGRPVVFLHGNTASSRMFEMILPLYEGLQIILIDFLGHGKSDWLPEFPIELWFDEARQTIALLEHLKLADKANLVGTSGGAWVALNVGLERPDLVGKIVADSFSGKTLPDGFAESLIEERRQASNDPNGRMFYEWCQGDRWEHVVDCDTASLVQSAEQKRPLFWRELSELKVPLLLIGSKEDTMIGGHIEAEYDEVLNEAQDAELLFLDQGAHPTILSNAEQVAAKILEFLKR